MSAETLRRASEKLREQAADATPGAWTSAHTPHVVDMGIPRRSRTPYAVCYGDRDVDQNGKNADYIATMHPGVGLALADWLKSEAAIAEACEADGFETGSQFPGLILARLILGESP